MTVAQDTNIVALTHICQRTDKLTCKLKYNEKLNIVKIFYQLIIKSLTF